MAAESDRWHDLRNAWSTWLASPDDWQQVGEVERAVDAWSEDDRAAPVAWLRGRIAGGERPACWRTYGAPDGGWGGFFSRDGDPRADLIDAVELDHLQLQPHELARLIGRAGQIRELVLIEANLLPSVTTLFAPDVRWSSLERLHLEASCNDDDLRAIAGAHLPAMHELTVRDEEPLTPAVAELTGASWWCQLRGLTLGDAPEDVLLALAAVDAPALETLELTDPTEAVLAAWRDPVRRPRLRDVSRY